MSLRIVEPCSSVMVTYIWLRISYFLVSSLFYINKQKGGYWYSYVSEARNRKLRHTMTGAMWEYRSCILGKHLKAWSPITLNIPTLSQCLEKAQSDPFILLQEIMSWDRSLWGRLAGSNVYCAGTDSADLCPKAEPREQRGLTLYTLASRLQKQKAKLNPHMAACDSISYFISPVLCDHVSVL
jgi:hypothetical protein